MVVHISAADFLAIGLDVAGFNGRQANRSAKTNKRRFLGHYGVTPESCSKIFDDLQTTQIPEARISKPDVDNFLMGLCWLKTYPIEEESAGKFKVVEKTARKHVWKYVNAIAALKGQKVSSPCW
jgi:hypothetical protein